MLPDLLREYVKAMGAIFGFIVAPAFLLWWISRPAVRFMEEHRTAVAQAERNKRILKMLATKMGFTIDEMFDTMYGPNTNPYDAKWAPTPRPATLSPGLMLSRSRR